MNLHSSSRRRLPLLGALALLGSTLLTLAQGPTLLAYWDFNDGSEVSTSTLDKRYGWEGTLTNFAAFTADAGGVTGTAGDRAMDFGTTANTGNRVQVANAGWLNTASEADKVTFSFWQKLVNVANSSSFWAVSPSSTGAQRGAQAHSPYGSAASPTIYWDTAGCCEANLRRINRAVNTTSIPGYTADYFTSWRHFAYVKDGAAKRIYVNGLLFHSGTGALPLPKDFTELSIGAQNTGANNIQGLIDDFAVFASALTTNEISALVAGTKPDKLPGVAATPPIILKATPGGGPGASPESIFNIEIADGSTPIVQSSVKLFLDGTELAAQVTKNGSRTLIQYSSTNLFTSASLHAVRIEYNNGAPGVLAYAFSVAEYAVLESYDKVTADTAKPGFLWNVHQQTTNTAATLARAENQLLGLVAGNFADPNQTSPALGAGTPGATTNLPIRFEIAGVINLDQTASFDPQGNPRDYMPGIPGVTGSNEGIAAEILTFVELSVGLNKLIVNSDEGFRMTAGRYYRDMFRRQQAGVWDGARTSADTTCYLLVKEAGVYPIRIVYFDATGTANIELKQVAGGVTNRLNDVANGGWKAYRANVGGNPVATAITSVNPTRNATGIETNAPLWVVIEENDAQVDLGTVRLWLNGQHVSSTTARTNNLVTVTAQTPAWPSATPCTAEIVFTAGTARTQQWQFTTKTVLPNTLVAYWDFNDASNPTNALDRIGQVEAIFTNLAAFSADATGFSGKAGDRSLDLGADPNATNDISGAIVTNVAFFAQASQRDQLTVSFWSILPVAATSLGNNNAFWLEPGRAASVQVPWSNNGLYWDTAGCCDVGLQRTDRAITQFQPYINAGNTAAWWQSWHHFAFTKNAAQKRIYVDGILFMERLNTFPFPAGPFTHLVIGMEPTLANSHKGRIDDLAIFANEVQGPDIAALAAGTSPLSLGGAPRFTGIRLSSGKVILEWTSGTLAETGTLPGGSWTPLTNAVSPYQVDPVGQMKFYRLQ